MIREQIQTIQNDTTLNVTYSEIDSIRKRTITETGCRIYHKGKIGIAGTYGEATDATWKEAEANLQLGIPYPFAPAQENSRHRDSRKRTMDQTEFLHFAEQTLATLNQEFPEFIFSNKFVMTETITSIKNDAGLDYSDADSSITIGLLVKHVQSINIMDTFLVREQRVLDAEQFLNETRELLHAFNRPVPLPNRKKMPVIATMDSYLQKFSEELNGKTLGHKVSLFQEKMGQTVFSNDFTLLIDRTTKDPHTRFFDKEGSTLLQDQYAVIQQGKIISGYADKKTASEFGVPNTACATGSVDDVPTLGGAPFRIAPSSKTLSQLLQGEEAILSVMSSGGDFTPDGAYASPVQMAYLVKDGKLIGKLPELSIASNIYDMFNQGYRGVSQDKPWSDIHFLVTDMNIIP